MALPATDNFNAADQNPIAGNWSIPTGYGTVERYLNQAHPNGANDNAAYWNADTFNKDQYSQCLCTTISDGGPAVRLASGAETGYHLYVQSTILKIGKMVAGSYTQLGSSVSRTNSTSETFKLSATGTTLEVFVDGSSQFTRTDSSISDGSAGLQGYSSSTYMDNWEGGNVGGGGGGFNAGFANKATSGVLGTGVY